MGKEAACAVVSGTKRGPVKAHLDGERLRVTGAIRLDIPLGDLRRVTVREGALVFDARGETVALELGVKAAAAWERAIAQPKSLLEKLGVKPEQRICILGLGDAFRDDVTTAAKAAPSFALRGNFDLIFCGIESESELIRVERCRDHLVSNGALWIVAPKGKGSPVRENMLRAALVAAGLVDTKVASFSASHTAVKAVIPVASRAPVRVI
jgi:hypothetical protein